MYEKRCDKCAAWDRDGIDGICRRFAPKPVIFDMSTKSGEPNPKLTMIWPKTNPEDKCGDFIDALEHSTPQ